jgi:undecaprenyl-diphosphatase
MYDILISVLLGIVQGATEFIPISSSGHLILVRDILGIETIGTLGFDAILQLATALAVLVYFRVEFIELFFSFISMIRGQAIESSQRVLLLAILLGTIPAALLGLLLQDYMETTFRSASFVAVTLLLGSLLFFFAERVAKQDSFLTLRKGIGIGFFQALALFPGTSRSGATISGGLILGLTREQAARFSFLLSFPIIFGSGLVKLFGLSGSAVSINAELLIGAIAAFSVGLWAIHFLLRFLRNHTLSLFIWYRVILAVIVSITLI